MIAGLLIWSPLLFAAPDTNIANIGKVEMPVAGSAAEASKAAEAKKAEIERTPFFVLSRERLSSACAILEAINSHRTMGTLSYLAKHSFFAPFKNRQEIKIL